MKAIRPTPTPIALLPAPVAKQRPVTSVAFQVGSVGAKWTRIGCARPAGDTVARGVPSRLRSWKDSKVAQFASASPRWTDRLTRDSDSPQTVIETVGRLPGSFQFGPSLDKSPKLDPFVLYFIVKDPTLLISTTTITQSASIFTSQTSRQQPQPYYLHFTRLVASKDFVLFPVAVVSASPTILPTFCNQKLNESSRTA